MKKILSILFFTNICILFIHAEEKEKLIIIPEKELHKIFNDRKFDDTDEKNNLVAELSNKELPLSEVEKRVKQFIKISREKQINDNPMFKDIMNHKRNKIHLDVFIRQEFMLIISLIKLESLAMRHQMRANS